MRFHRGVLMVGSEGVIVSDCRRLEVNRDVRPYRSHCLPELQRAACNDYHDIAYSIHIRTMSGSMGYLGLGAIEQCVPLERSLLCVQPNAETQQFVSQALADYRLVVVRTAFDALRWMDRSTFDGCILD